MPSPSSAVAAWRSLDDGRHRAEFYRMWRAGHSVGFTHPRSLEVMGLRQSPATEAMRQWILAGTAQGRDLVTLMRTGSARFESFERGLLALGEESGRLDEALGMLAEFYTRKHRLMLWVKRQMAYPVMCGFAASFIAPILLLVFGHPAAYAFFAVSAATALALGAGGAITAIAASYGRRPPLVRARMARALATAIEAGLALPRAVRLAAEASSDPDVVAYVGDRGERALATASLVDTLSRCPHMTPEFLAVINTAEVTGDYTPLSRLADLYEDGFR
jgi:type II secretory pathway component PulF